MIKLLIAEDEHISLMALKKNIELLVPQIGAIKTASNGNIAVEIAMDFCPDIVLLDIEMPVLNGIDAAKIIRNKLPNTHIIFLTAYSNFDYAVDAIKLKATDYIIKPCLDDELQQKLLDLCYLINPELNRKQEDISESLFKLKVNSYIENNFSKDISLICMSDYMDMSTFYFSKLFKNEYNQNFIDYITEYKIKKSASLLQNTELTVREIGIMCGYADSNYFAKVFKKVMNCTPTIFRHNKQKI